MEIKILNLNKFNKANTNIFKDIFSGFPNEIHNTHSYLFMTQIQDYINAVLFSLREHPSSSLQKDLHSYQPRGQVKNPPSLSQA